MRLRPMFDYRCVGGHIFASPPNEQGIPWATLVCPTCGATGLRVFSADESHPKGEALNPRPDPNLAGDYAAEEQK